MEVWNEGLGFPMEVWNYKPTLRLRWEREALGFRMEEYEDNLPW